MKRRRPDPNALLRARGKARPAEILGRPSHGGGELVLAEMPVPPDLEARLVGESNSYVRAYTLGECSVLVTKENGRWHLSVAHQRRLPTWAEVATARYRIVPDGVVMGMLLPPKAAYVNLHEHCFQLYELTGNLQPEWTP